MWLIPCGRMAATVVWDVIGLWLDDNVGFTTVVSFCCWWRRRNNWRWSGGSWLTSTPATSDGCRACHAVDVTAADDVISATLTDVKDDARVDDMADAGSMDDVGNMWPVAGSIDSELVVPTWDVMSAMGKLSALAPTDSVGAASLVNPGPGMTVTLSVGNPAANNWQYITHYYCYLIWSLNENSATDGSVTNSQNLLYYKCCH